MTPSATEKQNLINEYNSADSAGKEMLKRLFGESTFLPEPKEMVKCWEDYCKLKGIDPIKSLPYPNPSKSEEGPTDEEATNAFYQLTQLFSFFNGSWKADWEDSSQRKWYPWFKMKSGFGFSDTLYVSTYSFTSVGSRLCCKDSETAEFMGRQFIDLYKKLLTK